MFQFPPHKPKFNHWTQEDQDRTILAFSVASFFLLIPIYFLRKEIFHAWWRFAKWYLVIPLAYMIFPQQTHNGWISDPFGDVESQPLFFAILFFFTSLGIIIAKWRKLRGK